MPGLITESGIENVELDPDAIYVNIRFTPVNLYGIASGKRQRYINDLVASTQCSVNLPLAFSIYEEHMPDFFTVFHSDNHLVAIPSYLIVLTKLHRMK